MYEKDYAALKAAGQPVDARAMSVDPMRHPGDQSTPDVAYLDSARIQRSESPAAQIEDLTRRLDTERSAGKAMMVAMLDLEGRLDIERGAGQALLATVRDLDGSLDEERKNLRQQRLANTRLWSDLHGLEAELRRAERPLWKKLLRR